jgi:hypothetical protein
MKQRLRQRLNYSNLIATLALFIALGGVAVAAGVPKHSVGPQQLKRGAVHAAAIAKNAVNSGKIAPNSVTTKALGNGVVNSAKIAAGGVLAAAIKNGVVTANKLANAAVTTTKLADGSVTNAKLGSEVAPLLGTLKSGQTLRGSFDIGGEGLFFRSAQSFPFPLTNPPASGTNILEANAATAACPGLKGGNQQTPEAAAGQLCVYVKTSDGTKPELAFDTGSVTRLGFGLTAEFETAAKANLIQGFWAVTAP